MGTEADICRIYVTPNLRASGWSDDQIREQVTFTAGRILVAGKQVKRAKPKRADYILCYRRDYPLAVVEAKSHYHRATDGMQQAKDYAQILGVEFAYATNGPAIVEFDFTTGIEQEIVQFPSPAELWNRHRSARGLDATLENKILAPYHLSDKKPRYYQQIAINRAVEAIVTGKDRVLLTLATGTGKTVIAFQIAWKLWNSQWNRKGQPQRRPRILFLADRAVLVDDPKDKDFAPFEDARYKIEQGKAIKSREIYFATYQALARDQEYPGLYREYAPDFFDLIIVDEAHRGSARDDSSWREILDYFTGAAQLGMTATPLRTDNRDTYAYFGDPVYVYSLRQGIMDGFLAPYQVRRVITDVDAAGYRPFAGELDALGREIPDQVYETPQFERKLSIPSRTEAIARHLTNYLKSTDRFAKTIVFCVDQEHADQMRQALANANADLLREYPNYVARVTNDEGEIGRNFLKSFQDVETRTPVILTTSKLLTTGVDAPLVKNVVLVNVINSMTEFKQIIGRGTRVREDYGKLYFTILDYTGTATRNFADPEFDGEPVASLKVTLDEQGNVVAEQAEEDAAPATLAEEQEAYIVEPPRILWKDAPPPPRKYYVAARGVSVNVVHEMVQELDADGKQLRVVELTTYTGEQVSSLYPSADDLRGLWQASDSRKQIIETLRERGIEIAYVAEVMDQPDADPFDLLCHLAFHAPLRSRRERADRLRRERDEFFARYSPAAREVLERIIAHYAEHGPAEIVLPDVLDLPQVTRNRTMMEMAATFGGLEPMVDAITELQTLLYAA